MFPASAILGPSKPDVPIDHRQARLDAPAHAVEHGRWTGEVHDHVAPFEHVARFTDIDRRNEFEIVS